MCSEISHSLEVARSLSWCQKDGSIGSSVYLACRSSRLDLSYHICTSHGALPRVPRPPEHWARTSSWGRCQKLKFLKTCLPMNLDIEDKQLDTKSPCSQLTAKSSTAFPFYCMVVIFTFDVWNMFSSLLCLEHELTWWEIDFKYVVPLSQHVVDLFPIWKVFLSPTSFTLLFLSFISRSIYRRRDMPK